LSVKVPVEFWPEPTAPGLNVSPVSIGGFTVRIAAPGPLNVAVMVTELCAATGKVMTGKLAIAAPAATVAVSWTVAAAVFELVSITVIPPVGAALEINTVPLTAVPPVTMDCESPTETIDGGVMVRMAPMLPFSVAVIVAIT
jgi:hypothetical protein